MRTLKIRAEADELANLRLCARLRRISVAEYVKRALNMQMRREGVDAVLFKTKELF